MSGGTYVTQAELEATLSITGFSIGTADSNAAILAACRAIDLACNRPNGFGTATAGTFYYSPEQPNLLEIDDAGTITAVDTDLTGTYTYPNSWAELTDYIVEPLNAAAVSWPYTHLRTNPNSALWWPTTYPRSVRVTGTFGWPATPAPIKEATTLLAARLMKLAREAPFGIAMFGDQAIRLARYDPQICALLDPYNKHRIAVA